MKNCILLMLVGALVPGVSFSACHAYLLPTECSIAVGVDDTLHAESVEIIAWEGKCGVPESPFRVIGYDKTHAKIFDRVFGGNGVSTNELSATCGLDVDIVGDDFSIRDPLYRLQAKKMQGTYLVSIVSLAQFGVHQEKLTSSSVSNRLEMVGALWPSVDGDRQHYYSNEVWAGADTSQEGLIPPGQGCLIVKGALYQKGNSFSILFELHRVKSGNDVVTKGRVVGKINDSKLEECKVIFDTASDGVELTVSLSETTAGELMKAPLERAGIKHDTVRMHVSSGLIQTDLDMRVIKDWDAIFCR